MCISDDEREREGRRREYLSRVFGNFGKSEPQINRKERKKRERRRELTHRKRKEEKKKRKKEKKNTYAASLESLASAVVEPTHVSINADYYYLGTVTYRLFLQDSLYRFILNHRSGLTPSPPLASKASFNSNGNASVH